MVKIPKSLKLDEIRRYAGDKFAEQVLTAFLRAKARAMVVISVKDMETVERLLGDPHSRHHGDSSAFGRVTLKWLTESKSGRSRCALKNYLSHLKKLVQREESVSRSHGPRRYVRKKK